MNQAIVILGRVQELPSYTNVDWIGVDYGADFLATRGIFMKLAIGDFDSTDALDEIRNCAEEVIVLPTLKEDTDSVHVVVIARAGRVCHVGWSFLSRWRFKKKRI